MDIHGSDLEAEPRDAREEEPVVATVDPRGVVTAWSEGARKLLGYPPTEIVERPAATLVDACVPEELRMAMATRRGWSGSLMLRHRDGDRLEALLRVVPMLDATGRIMAYLVSATSGEPLRLEQDRVLLDWAFGQSPIYLSLYDTDLRFRRMNEVACQLVGLREDQVRGRRADEVIADPDPDYTRYVRSLRQVAETGEPTRFESHTRAPHSTRLRAWRNSMWPAKDPTGRVQGVAIASFDATDEYAAGQRLAMLNAAATRIGSTLDMTRTAQELADIVVPRFADFASVDLLERLFHGEEPPPGPIGGKVVLRRSARSSESPGSAEDQWRSGQVAIHPASSPPAESLATGRSSVCPTDCPCFARWLDTDPVLAGAIRGRGHHSMVTVPIRARGATLGVAVFSRGAHASPFDDEDLHFAEELVARAAVALDNARRYTREHTTALALQHSLLPQRLSGQAAVEAAYRYLPAGTRAGVGGDWFDVIPLSGTRVALVVGDVVGHGIHASATMGRLRTAVRTLADVDLPPDELLTHLDDLVNRLSEEDRGEDQAAPGAVGATCLYAVYDPVSRCCTLASAGHPQPAAVTPDGAVDFLDLPLGPPLGLGHLPFEAAEVKLPEGSLLVLYTDGLIESRDRDLDAGLRELRRVLSAPDVSVETTCDLVLKAMLPGRPADDVALLIARTRVLDADRVASWLVADDPAAVADARADAIRQLADWGLVGEAFITELVVSELVTNAIRHAGPPIRLRLIRQEDTLICEVSDGSSTAPHLRRARVFDESGRGLLLVAQLTERWGSRQTPRGKTIWAELALHGL